MSRFIKLEAFFIEEGRLYFFNLWVNPFQVESFMELTVNYTGEEGEDVEIVGTKIITKSGEEYDINMGPDSLESLLNS